VFLITAVAPDWQRTAKYVLLKPVYLLKVQHLFKFCAYLMLPCIHQKLRCYTW